MSNLITFLTLTLFGAAAISGILAVFMAVMTVVSRPSRNIAEPARPSAAVDEDDVQVFFREPERNRRVNIEVNVAPKPAPVSVIKRTKKPVSRKKSPAVKKANVTEKLLAGLPGGYHILTNLELILDKAVKFKNEELTSSKIDCLVIGPRRIFVLKATAAARPNYKRLAEKLESDAKLIELFLSQKLKKEFKVCGWLAINKETPANKYPATIVHYDYLQEAIIKFERSSQGKSKLPSRDALAEIISVLKLAKWQQPEPRQMAAV